MPIADDVAGRACTSDDCGVGPAEGRGGEVAPLWEVSFTKRVGAHCPAPCAVARGLEGLRGLPALVSRSRGAEATTAAGRTGCSSRLPGVETGGVAMAGVTTGSARPDGDALCTEASRGDVIVAVSGLVASCGEDAAELGCEASGRAATNDRPALLLSSRRANSAMARGDCAMRRMSVWFRALTRATEDVSASRVLAMAGGGVPPWLFGGITARSPFFMFGTD